MPSPWEFGAPSYYKCDYCDRVFRTSIEAIGHERNKHGIAHPKVKKADIRKLTRLGLITKTRKR